MPNNSEWVSLERVVGWGVKFEVWGGPSEKNCCTRGRFPWISSPTLADKRLIMEELKIAAHFEGVVPLVDTHWASLLPRPRPLLLLPASASQQ